jgi:hypothetical protein
MEVSDTQGMQCFPVRFCGKVDPSLDLAHTLSTNPARDPAPLSYHQRTQ